MRKHVLKGSIVHSSMHSSRSQNKFDVEAFGGLWVANGIGYAWWELCPSDSTYLSPHKGGVDLPLPLCRCDPASLPKDRILWCIVSQSQSLRLFHVATPFCLSSLQWNEIPIPIIKEKTFLGHSQLCFSFHISLNYLLKKDFKRKKPCNFPKTYQRASRLKSAGWEPLQSNVY